MCSDPEIERTNSCSSWANSGTVYECMCYSDTVCFNALENKTQAEAWYSLLLQASSILPQFVLQQQQPEVLLTPQVVNLNPQMAGPFGPQGPQLLFPNQGNQLTPMLVPNGQQEQLGPPQDPNAPNVPQQAQNPMQVQQRVFIGFYKTPTSQKINHTCESFKMYPQFQQFQYPAYGFPQLPRQQVPCHAHWLVGVCQYLPLDASFRFKLFRSTDLPQGFQYFVPSYGFPQQRNTALPQPNKGQQNLERTTQRPQLPLQVRHAKLKNKSGYKEGLRKISHKGKF